jgi:hypothetical protein
MYDPVFKFLSIIDGSCHSEGALILEFGLKLEREKNDIRSQGENEGR